MSRPSEDTARLEILELVAVATLSEVLRPDVLGSPTKAPEHVGELVKAAAARQEADGAAQRPATAAT